MATNFTATTRWRTVRDTARRQAQDRGQTQCPLCQVTLNWKVSRTPTSAEVDHIIARANGGDLYDLNNLQCICRLCNQSKGSRQAPGQAKTNHATPFVNNRW